MFNHLYKILAVSIVLISLIYFAFLRTENLKTENDDGNQKRFKARYIQGQLYIIKDNQTGKEYLMVNTGHGCGLTELKD